MRKVLGTVFLLTGVASAALIVDDFTSPAHSAQNCGGPTPTAPVTNTASSATNTISGERTIATQIDAYLGVINGCSDITTSTPGELNIIDTDGIFSTSVITWTIPGSVDLSSYTFLQVDIGQTGRTAPYDVSTFAIRFDSAGGSGVRLWSVTDNFPMTTYLFNLNTLVGGVDWTQITKVSLTIDTNGPGSLTSSSLQTASSASLSVAGILLETPEPSTALLFGSAVAVIALRRRR